MNYIVVILLLSSCWLQVDGARKQPMARRGNGLSPHVGQQGGIRRAATSRPNKNARPKQAAASAPSTSAMPQPRLSPLERFKNAISSVINLNRASRASHSPQHAQQIQAANPMLEQIRTFDQKSLRPTRSVLATAGKEPRAGQDIYDMLKLPRTATTQEVIQAYRRQALKLHPDKGGDAEQFKALQTAKDHYENSRNQQNSARRYATAEQRLLTYEPPMPNPRTLQKQHARFKQEYPAHVPRRQEPLLLDNKPYNATTRSERAMSTDRNRAPSIQGEKPSRRLSTRAKAAIGGSILGGAAIGGAVAGGISASGSSSAPQTSYAPDGDEQSLPSGTESGAGQEEGYAS